jgi:hypothetical protein
MVILDFLRDAFWGGVDWLNENRWVFWLLVIAIVATAVWFVSIFIAHTYAHVWATFDWNEVPDLTPKQFEWSVLTLLFFIWLKSTSVTVNCKHKDCECKK